uniref:Uncharacterized protein n=1 Tax=Engystomops pustulosus TaxID=76066 RepID=A0AAV6YZG1_ENGPU|nr:hypothetical protein GDO81_019425 [Engystomops pustulosus]
MRGVSPHRMPCSDITIFSHDTFRGEIPSFPDVTYNNLLVCILHSPWNMGDIHPCSKFRCSFAVRYSAYTCCRHVLFCTRCCTI